jgi:YD repeat-containing protein
MAMSYEYNDANHLNAVTDIKLNGTDYDFDYDANGNMTDGYDLTDPSGVETRDLTFDADNMPTTIVHGDAGTTTILYDGEGKRAKKTNGGNTTRYINKYYEIINGVATKYVFAGNLRIAKIDSSGTYYYHKDHLGSSTVMTNSSGESVEFSEYLPYGGERDQAGSLISNYKFTDQREIGDRYFMLTNKQQWNKGY